jgi:hypothetical protein
MFTKKITKEVVIEEDGKTTGTVIIRKLSAKSLGKVREQKQIASFQLTSKMGSDMIKAFRQTAMEREELDKHAAQAEDPTPEDRYSQYDRDSTLEKGIVSWSFEEKLREGLEDMDEPSSEHLFHEIIDLSDPPPSEKIAEGKAD